MTKYLGNLELSLEERKNIRENEMFLWTLWNAISSSYSCDQITCKPSLISLYMAAVVMVWQLIECPHSSKHAITSFKTFCDMDELKTSVFFDVITKWNTIDTACFHPLQTSRITPSQLLPSNLVTNILFHIL